MDLDVVLAVDEAGPAEWSHGVPNAMAWYARTSSHGFLWTGVRVDSVGHLDLTRLDPGLYWVVAEASADATGQLYGGGEKVLLHSSGVTETVSVPVFGSRSGSLVISELYVNEPPPWVYETDGESKYLEIYNNAGSTIHLDGKLIGLFYNYWWDSGRYGHHRCEDTEPLRNDEAGVWAAVIWRFPGSGTDHPVEPGRTALIAVSAADHRAGHASFLDLSGADFEFLLHGMADNPSVPNMEGVGTRPHRMQDFLGDSPWFIADEQDPAALPRLRDPGGDPGNPYTDYFVRIPANTLHDVAYLKTNRYGEYHSLPVLPTCREPVFAGFNRIPADHITSEVALLQSIQRRVLDGRLLDTNVSQVDFRMASRTPGRVN